MPSPADYLRSQSLAPLAMSSAQWSLISSQLRERAFFMAGVQEANILQLFRDAAAAVADGRMSPSEARVTVRRGLSSMGYSPQAAGVAPGSIHDLSSYRRIMLALETNFSMARGWMQHLQYRTDPNVGGLELFRLFPRKVPRNWALRWAEAAEQVNWQGVATGAPFIATLDSPIWCALSRFGTPYPPFDFNSGMSTRPVDNRRCRELGLEPTPKPEILPSLNEQVEASLQGLDADIAADLLRSLGALVQRDGDTLKMTDLNGTKPYPLQELVRLLAGALPPGVPNMQGKALAAWKADPSSLLPGGKNADLLPALAAFASRLSPAAPKDLSDFLKQARQKKTGTPQKNGLQSATNPHGANEPTDRRTQDRSLRREREIHSLDHPGGGSQDERGLRRRVHVRQAYGLLSSQVPEATRAETERVAQITAAQLNAVFDGRKPAFLETVPEFTSSFAKDLPPGVRFVKAGGIECIYNETAVVKELNLPPGADVDAVVREKLEQGAYGSLLGYGLDTAMERPCSYVKIKDGERNVFGFMAPADKQEALKYAAERLEDFKKEFPQGQWSFSLDPLPAPPAR